MRSAKNITLLVDTVALGYDDLVMVKIQFNWLHPAHVTWTCVNQILFSLHPLLVGYETRN